ncbi:hypothetical protein [Calothrix sp. NIES-2098]|uniref:hypothetical protein n=1 Tax=Calothrix sp. NIES-2098 TaxID=1954171 RepID=UPI000B60520F|nr:hypothetical protein NIES2098_17760 [Calothrix sp. NIES-2098]
MAEPTIAQIFGTGATRLASGASAPSAGLFIPDTALIAAGLTTPTTASGEGHFVAVLINGQTYLTQTAFDSNIDQSIYVSTGFSSFTTRGTDNDPYTVRQLTINLAKLDDGSTLNPGDY